MATPAREAIVNDLVTALTAISTGGGYKTTVKKVERVPRTFVAVDPNDRPWVGVQVGQDQKQHFPFGRIRCVLPVRVHAYVLGTSLTGKQATVNDLEDDIISAVEKDTRRAGNAALTTIVDSDDENIPDDLQGYLQVNLEVVYWRTTAST